jgi:3-hydroxybutyryl-CoA dehydratase
MKLNVGDTLKPFRIESVSPEGMKAWAKFLHDPNPIHLDPAVVKAKGLGERVINQGPANLAYLINMLQAAFPGGFIESLEVRYVDNVFGGDAVEAGGTVKDIVSAGSKSRIASEVWLRAEGRGPVLTGSAVVAIPKP